MVDDWRKRRAVTRRPEGVAGSVRCVSKAESRRNTVPVEGSGWAAHDGEGLHARCFFLPRTLVTRAACRMVGNSTSLRNLCLVCRAAEACSTEDCPIKMKLVAPPLYVLTTQTLDKNKGVDALTAGRSWTKMRAWMH